MPRRDNPWSKKIPDRQWDYIVIGSGMGGMTTAALLAKAGFRVLVLEQHYVAGGFTHTFRRKRWVWDVGVHAVGEVTTHTMPGRLLHHLTDGKLEWASLGPVYDEFHFPGEFRIDFPDSPQKFRANLLEAFPNEEAAIDEYLRYVRDVASEMKGYYLSRSLPKGLGAVADKLIAKKAANYLGLRTQDVLEELTQDERLRTVLASQWGYYGSPPSRASFAMQALVTKHFLHGGYYPVGGSQRISQCLLQTVADAGGWTAIRADVKRILVDDGRAVGVQLDGGKVVRANKVVSAAGIMSTVSRLLPESYRKEAWAESIEALEPAPAHVCLYIGFKGDIRKAGASGANKWFYQTWSTEDTSWDVSGETLGDAPILYCSFPSLKDPDHDPTDEELHTGEVVTFVPWDTFADYTDEPWRNRSEPYQGIKQRVQDSLLKQFLKHMPELESMIEFVELSTPASTHHFCRPMRGSIYGIEPTAERFDNMWLRPRTPIENLFFSGSEVASVGVIGAMMGGVLAAASAEPRKVGSIVMNAAKR